MPRYVVTRDRETTREKDSRRETSAPNPLMHYKVQMGHAELVMTFWIFLEQSLANSKGSSTGKNENGYSRTSHFITRDSYWVHFFPFWTESWNLLRGKQCHCSPQRLCHCFCLLMKRRWGKSRIMVKKKRLQYIFCCSIVHDVQGREKKLCLLFEVISLLL